MAGEGGFKTRSELPPGAGPAGALCAYPPSLVLAGLAARVREHLGDPRPRGRAAVHEQDPWTAARAVQVVHSNMRAGASEADLKSA